MNIVYNQVLTESSGDNLTGMPEQTKSETLEKFRHGDVNLLVATSVGSEGIDVPECNFIITYNFTGNETTISQMSGKHLLSETHI